MPRYYFDTDITCICSLLLS